MIPRATYRLQFHKAFRFEHAARLADYFAKLGISHIYASPILKARAGSTHGYNVVDFGQINPELGGEVQFRLMVRELRARGIGIIVDIVPNHMAVGQNDNAWWLDVLRNGRASAFADYFDIDWDAPGLEDKILAPFIDGPPEQAFQQGKLKLVRENGEIAFAYYDHRFPLRQEDSAALRDADLATLTKDDMTSLLARQHYVLSDWRDADARINWRRFFDITELAALRMENDAAFEAVHAKTLALYAEGLIDGLRVDHIDGLSDPCAYCRKLRACLDAREMPESGRAYLIVEKILAADEALPDDWLVNGTTGYDFMEDVSALLHAPDESATLSRFWSTVSSHSESFEPEELLARNETLNRNFVAQRDAAVRALAASAPSATQEAFADILVHLSAYRTYATGQVESPEPGPYLEKAVAAAKEAASGHAPAIDAIDHLMRTRSGEPSDMLAVRRFNQLSAPLAAKSVEDTAFYRYGRLLSRNEVGSDPRMTGMAVREFHRKIAESAQVFPNTMLTTATHDHKRGEDARARLAVLSEIPDLWCERAKEWLGLMPSHIDHGDAYQLLQTIVGAWPLGGLAEAALPQFLERITQWCRKFLREAKLRSSWLSPDTHYEEKLASAANALIVRGRTDFDGFIDHISPAAIANTLAQTVLRMTCPGMPDLYQGREGWDFSLVDPDNRAAIDFDALGHAQSAGSELVSNPASWRGDHRKVALVSRLLDARRRHADIFRSGTYKPVAVEGSQANHILAFERRDGERSALVAVSLRCASVLCGRHEIAPPSDWWGDTHLVTRSLPVMREVLTDATISEYPIAAADLFEVLPVAVLCPN
jgi:(1->4)-alpha-D-glucan 1-alpha-D-glucosylmutase